MEATKVTIIDPGMLNSPLLSKSKKRELKENLVKEYIRSKPAGMPIPPSKLIVAAHYDPNTQYQSGWAFVNNMVKKGIILKEKIVRSDSSYWTVPGDATTVVPPTEKSTEDLIGDDQAINRVWPSEPLNSIIDPPKDVSWIITKAKEFAWRENSDSLREFIDYIIKERVE